MRRLKASLIAGALVLAGSGCSSFEGRPNPWPDQRLEVDAPAPAELPAWPDIGDDLTLTPEQAEALLLWADVAEANTEVARELSAAVDELSASHNALVEAGGAEHELAELRGRMLHEERRARLWDKILWGAVGFMGIVGAAR